MKTCSKCKIEKLETDFHKCSKNKNKLYACCKSCKRDYRRLHRSVDYSWNKKNPDKVWASALQKFGITIEVYNALLDSQKGVCAICEQKCRTRPRLAVDHCHGTGQIRGLLCFNCNTTLGKFKDSPALFRRAGEYLERNK